MPARLRRLPPDQVARLLAARRSGALDREDERALVKHLLAVLTERAPGSSVELRVPPYAAIQCVPGARHTRGTPPAVVELSAPAWVALALGERTWSEVEAAGELVASGERSDLSPHLPLLDHPPPGPGS